MKIIKFPSENIITCKCGCEFEFDEKDIETEEVWSLNRTLRSVYVVCPYCHKKHLLKRYQDENTSD